MPRADRIKAATLRADSSTTDSTLTFEVEAEGIESPTKAIQVIAYRQIRFFNGKILKHRQNRKQDRQLVELLRKQRKAVR